MTPPVKEPALTLHAARGVRPTGLGGSQGVGSGTGTGADSVQEVWRLLLQHMRTHAPDICRHWFEELEPLSVTGGVLYIRAHSLVHRDYLHRACNKRFNEAGQTATGRLISVRFLGPDEELPGTPSSVVVMPGAGSTLGASATRGAVHGPSIDHAQRVHQGPTSGAARSVPGSAPGGAPSGAPSAVPDDRGLAPEARGLGNAHHANDAHGLAARATHAAHAPQAMPDLDAMRAARRGDAPGLGAPGFGGESFGAQGQGAGTMGEFGNERVEYASGMNAGGTGGGFDSEDQLPVLTGEEAAMAPVRVEVGPIEHLYDDGLVLNPDNSFEHFVVGPGNRLAHAAAQAVGKAPGRAYNPYFVHGAVGLGKTHLLQAICLAIRKERPGAVIYYTSCEGFMTQFIDAVAAGMMTRFRYKFRHVDVLVIDDIHFLAKRDRTQEEFFHTFNALHQSRKQLVLSSDAPPEEIPALEARLVSRFKWGLVTSVSAPCYETRVEILRQKARLRGIELGLDVAGYVATKIDTNIRELEGAIGKLQIMSAMDRRPIDVELARLALGELEPASAPKIQIQTIVNAVTDYFGVKVTDLQSKRRQRSIAQPRQLCMWLARRHTRYSLEEIGGFFGGRDHTTVMHAVKAIEDRCETDKEFGGVVRTIEDQIRAPGVGGMGGMGGGRGAATQGG
jgi:chromosomal replication initiator protein